RPRPARRAAEGEVGDHAGWLAPRGLRSVAGRKELEARGPHVHHPVRLTARGDRLRRELRYVEDRGSQHVNVEAGQPLGVADGQGDMVYAGQTEAVGRNRSPPPEVWSGFVVRISNVLPHAPC